MAHLFAGRFKKLTKRAQFFSIRAQLVAYCLFLLAISFAVSAALLVVFANEFRYARKNYAALKFYREVMVAANAISAERGPTNTLLGGDFPASSEPAQRFVQFRKRSDDTLENIYKVSAEIGERPPWNELLTTKYVLMDARRRVDHELSKTFKERDLLTIQQAIEGMFSAVDAIKPLINMTALYAVDGNRRFVDAALTGQHLFEIRDYAGRLGSILNPYIAKRQAIRADDENRLHQTFGRIAELWDITKPYIERFPVLSMEIGSVEGVFFKVGVGVIKTIEEEARSGNYTFTSQTMTNALVPTFAPLEKMRLSYLDVMLDEAESHLESALRWLVIIGLVLGLIITIDIILIVGAQRMIFGPLLRARESIVALAEERDLQAAPVNARGGEEIEEVFHALNVLREKLLERKELTTRLSVQASTDGLTGLMNRRTLDDIYETHLSKGSPAENMGLIILDIDHFKNINDTYGHAVGDEVLRAVAGILVANVRASDVTARYGGEEFAVVALVETVAQAEGLAEKLRDAIDRSWISVGEGRQLRITASFGVAIGQRGLAEWRPLFEAADKALYRAKQEGRNRVCLGDVHAA